MEKVKCNLWVNGVCVLSQGGWGRIKVRCKTKKHCPFWHNEKIKRKRKLSNWQKYVAKYLKQGKTIQEAAKNWKKLKERSR